MPIYNLVYWIQTAPWPTPILPSAYQEVEYIQTAWKSYLEIWWFTVSSYERLEYKFNPVDFSTESWAIPFFFGNVPSGQNYLTTDSNKSNFQVWAWNSDLVITSISANTDYTIVQTMDNGSLTMVINWTTYTDSYSWSLNASHFPLFCRYRGSGAGYNYWAYNMKLYYFKIYDSADNCVRDIVPCYRKADGEIWAYDLINDVFYTNPTSDILLKWPDVN